MITATVLIMTVGIEIVLGILSYENKENDNYKAKKLLY